MLNITHSSIFVLDQDEALDFYVGKLGFEVSADVDMGFMRWLTISAPGDPDREILLERPGPPAHDDATAEQVRELVTKGAAGFALGLRTDDLRKTYEELKAKGVEFTDEPTERFYGIDCGLRDPFGNNIRIVQPAPGPLVAPDPAQLAPELRAMVAGARPHATCCARGTSPTVATPSRSTSPSSRERPACPPRTSAASSHARSARPRTATC